MESFLVSKLLIHRIKNRRGIIRTSDNFQKLFFPMHATVSTPQQVGGAPYRAGKLDRRVEFCH